MCVRAYRPTAVGPLGAQRRRRAPRPPASRLPASRLPAPRQLPAWYPGERVVCCNGSDPAHTGSRRRARAPAAPVLRAAAPAAPSGRGHRTRPGGGPTGDRRNLPAAPHPARARQKSPRRRAAAPLPTPSPVAAPRRFLRQPQPDPRRLESGARTGAPSPGRRAADGDPDGPAAPVAESTATRTDSDCAAGRKPRQGPAVPTPRAAPAHGVNELRSLDEEASRPLGCAVSVACWYPPVVV